MSSGHGHINYLHTFKRINRAFLIGIILNAGFTITEFIIGYITNSLALIADAGHNLSDVASLIISLLGMKLAQKAATVTYTYGYKKASILASLINAVLLIIVVINIFIEGIERLNSPPEVKGQMIILTALIGVGINTFSALLFYKGQKADINIKAAFLHLMIDALISVGVVISGVILYYTDWNIIDTIVSFAVGVVILVSTWGLFRESLKLTLGGVPKEIDVEKIKRMILEHPEVTGMHHLHIWALSSTENALTVHMILKQNAYEAHSMMQIKKEIKEQLSLQNIHHSTIEIDTDISECSDIGC